MMTISTVSHRIMQNDNLGEKKARKILAKRIRLLRTAHGWSQEVLAEISGLHRTYISMIERGVCNIGLDNIERLATALGVPVDGLLNPFQPIPIEDVGEGASDAGVS